MNTDTIFFSYFTLPVFKNYRCLATMSGLLLRGYIHKTTMEVCMVLYNKEYFSKILENLPYFRSHFVNNGSGRIILYFERFRIPYDIDSYAFTISWSNLTVLEIKLI